MNKLIKQAFTLIELLVVIAIIGILSGLIVVSMGGMTQKATIAKAQVFSNSLKNSLMLNLISEWKFDGSGVIDGNTATDIYAVDSWSGGNNGLIVGSPKVYSGSNCVNGSCLKFNGSTDYLDCGGANNLNFERNNPITISGWIKKGRLGAVEVILSKQEQSAAAKGWRILNQSNNTLSFALFNTTGNVSALIVNTVTSFTDINNWIYLTFTYNGSSSSSGVMAYINGATASLTVDSDNLNATIKTTTNVEIGARDGLNLPFSGLIDEIRIFNSVIPTSQIKEQYYAGLNSLLANGSISKLEYLNKINETAKK